jgi:uncharacterized protein
MPANLTPQYRSSEAKLKAAKSLEERKSALEEMLATIPKHKGTEKMQAELRRRMARLRHEEETRTAKHSHVIRVEPEGAAQIVLLGAPNSGKSSLLSALTRAEAPVADYPFTTTRPQPGMMGYEDVHIQLVDLPPIAHSHFDLWLPNVVRSADAAILLVDPTSQELPEDVEFIREKLASLHIPLVGELPEDADYRDTPLPTLMVVSKMDRARESDVQVLEELYGTEYPLLKLSVTQHSGFDAFKVAVWKRLQLVRVYSKPPGKPTDRNEPFVLPEGATIHDLAERIHREIGENLQFARVWGGKLDGQRVARDFELRDRDVVEVHA